MKPKSYAKVPSCLFPQTIISNQSNEEGPTLLFGHQILLDRGPTDIVTRQIGSSSMSTHGRLQWHRIEDMLGCAKFVKQHPGYMVKGRLGGLGDDSMDQGQDTRSTTVPGSQSFDEKEDIAVNG